MKKILMLLLLLTTLVGCNNKRKAFEDDYQMFVGVEHVFVKEDYKTVYNVLTNKSERSIILFAYNPNISLCPYCIEVLPIINEVALSLDIKKIYYLDIREMRTNRTKDYIALIEYIELQVDDLMIRNDKKEIIVPDIYVVEGGQIIGHHIATLTDEDGKFILGLNDEQKNELISIYTNLFKKS